MSREIKQFLLARYAVAAGIERERHCQGKENMTGRQNVLRTSHDRKAINIEQK
jgi:hypothetical protein